MSITDIATTLTIIASIIAIYGLVFGEKPLAGMAKKIWKRIKRRRVPRESTPPSTMIKTSDEAKDMVIRITGMETRGLVRFNKYVEDTKNWWVVVSMTRLLFMHKMSEME